MPSGKAPFNCSLPLPNLGFFQELLFKAELGLTALKNSTFTTGFFAYKIKAPLYLSWVEDEHYTLLKVRLSRIYSRMNQTSEAVM